MPIVIKKKSGEVIQPIKPPEPVSKDDIPFIEPPPKVPQNPNSKFFQSGQYCPNCKKTQMIACRNAKERSYCWTWLSKR